MVNICFYTALNFPLQHFNQTGFTTTFRNTKNILKFHLYDGQILQKSVNQFILFFKLLFSAPLLPKSHGSSKRGFWFLSHVFTILASCGWQIGICCVHLHTWCWYRFFWSRQQHAVWLPTAFEAKHSLCLTMSHFFPMQNIRFIKYYLNIQVKLCCFTKHFCRMQLIAPDRYKKQKTQKKSLVKLR